MKLIKQKCEDCNVQLVNDDEMDKTLIEFLKKKNSEKELPKKKLKELLEHKTIYCPKCFCLHGKDFKKTKMYLGILKKR